MKRGVNKSVWAIPLGCRLPLPSNMLPPIAEKSAVKQNSINLPLRMH